jgi:hypothetical protein
LLFGFDYAQPPIKILAYRQAGISASCLPAGRDFRFLPTGRQAIPKVTSATNLYPFAFKQNSHLEIKRDGCL